MLGTEQTSFRGSWILFWSLKSCQFGYRTDCQLQNKLIFWHTEIIRNKGPFPALFE